MRPIKIPKQKLTKAQLALKVGDDVILHKDSGELLTTKVRHPPYQAAGCNNIWVAFVDGVAGYYDLERIKPV